MESFRDVIGLWPSVSAFADEIGVGFFAARNWQQRNSIPPEYWDRIVASETAKKAGVTHADLARIAAKKLAGAA